MFFILLAITLIFFLIYKFIKSSINIIITGDVNNNDINIKLNIKYLFNLINIKVPLYPHKPLKDNDKMAKDKNNNESRTTEKKQIINKKAIEKEDIKIIYKLILKIKIEEVYSDINFGNEKINFTCFIYVLINTVYGNIINFIHPQKMYLNITPNYTQNYIRTNLKLHIKLTIKDIISISIALIKIYKKIKINKKDGGMSEINRVNTKPYGKNI